MSLVQLMFQQWFCKEVFISTVFYFCKKDLVWFSGTFYRLKKV